MRFGKIKKLLIIGGGDLLNRFSFEIKDKFDYKIVTSERHAPSIDKRLNFSIVRDINYDKNIIRWIDNGTLGISFGSAWIFKKDFIDLFGGKLLNVHGARLPQNRGGGGFSWQILQRNKRGFVLVHQVDESIDTGPIVDYEEFVYPPSCHIPKDYENIYIKKNYDFLIDFIKKIINNEDFALMPQQECFSTYFPRLSTKIHGFIDWSWPLEDIEAFVCAFDDPYVGASTFVNHKLVHLKQCFIDYNDGHFHPFEAGLVYRKSSQGLYVCAGKGTLVIQHTDRNDIKVGDRFYTPQRYLERALGMRVRYKPSVNKKRKQAFKTLIHHYQKY